MAYLPKRLAGNRKRATIDPRLKAAIDDVRVGKKEPPEITFGFFCENIVPKPRMTRRDRWAKRPCVERWKAFKKLVRLAYIQAGGKMYSGPVAVAFEFRVASRRVRDLDNMMKGVQDALLELAFADDNVGVIRQYDFARVIFWDEENAYNVNSKKEELVRIRIRPMKEKVYPGGMMTWE